MGGSDMELSREETALLGRVVTDVLAEKVFFSLGEMTTITGWSKGEVAALASALKAGHRTLSVSELRFLGQAWYAWFVAAKNGRLRAAEDEIDLGERFDQRRRAWAGR
ncbi:MAG: hypothetical protein ABMB14_17975 [Myxococcota bacterium]